MNRSELGSPICTHAAADVQGPTRLFRCMFLKIYNPAILAGLMEGELLRVVPTEKRAKSEPAGRGYLFFAVALRIICQSSWSSLAAS